MGIDPGINFTGICLCDLQLKNKQMLSLEAFTIAVNTLINDTGLDDEVVSERVVKLYKLKYAVRRVLDVYKPMVVAYESPFYNRLMPSAYGALMEVMTTIRSAVVEYNPYVPFIMIEPMLVKKAIGAGAMKGKEDVLNALKGRRDIMDVLRNDPNMLDEHSIDAIGVVYALLKFKGD